MKKTNHGCRIGDADGMMARFEDPATQCEIHDTKGYGGMAVSWVLLVNA
jgi:hypothetical protein